MKKALHFFGIVTLSSLAGCAITYLPNGEPSEMGREFNDLRSSLNVAPISSGFISSYLPVASCKYKRTFQQLDTSPKTENTSVSVKSIPNNPNKLLVVETDDGGKISTFLIDKYSGKLLDFNEIDPSSGQRVTPEDYQQIATTELANLPSNSNPHVVNDFSLFMPQFTAGQWNVNDVISDVNQEDGNPWAQYRYRGVTNYAGQDGEVFDLVRTMPNLSEYGPIMVGFMIFDPNTMTPILSILDAGGKSEVQRLVCSE